MQKDIEKILLSREAIAERVRELGEQISRDYQGKNLLVVGILKGALVFMADLVRQINIPVRLDFMVVSSYGSSSETSGVVRILKDLDMSVEGWHVLLVEDIIDTGLTLKYLRDNLLARGPESVKICALLDKPARRRVEVQADYCGFTIPDAFVVGYGLDYAEKYRNLPDLCVLKPEAWQK
ncbi:MAG: hypoxanthine phosphoribosyltransferase [Eubacteriales bacterium]|nr:hypoxanthine phosphoribosyltransferase [Eubacteriales bacterium]MDN5364702.1 hypoxanthine phosphoribosyltransferase [Eubacteriales bacterium]